MLTGMASTISSLHTDSIHADYCLRGLVAGVEQSFLLQPGENRVGSLESNEIFLPRRGVSRHHARVRLEGGKLQVEDLGSKNGTYVDGERVEKALVTAGSEVRFGPVELYFQVFHRDDAELAIAFDPPLSDQTSTIPIIDSAQRSAGLEQALSRHWLRLAEVFVARLGGQGGNDMAAALRVLLEELHLQGACVFEISQDQEAIVLAATGQIEQPATDRLRQLAASQMTSGARQDTFFFTSPEGDGHPVTLAALSPPAMDPMSPPTMDPLVLALWGGFPGRPKSELLLRLLIRILQPCQPRQLAEGPSKKRLTKFPGLVVPPDYVYAQSAVMGQIYELMQNLAQGDLPVLIIGETGVGKEYLSHILHFSSPRHQGPFVAINCAAIPAELLESELFGIGDGVATGVTASKGRLQLASGGTLFLDEIGDMSSDLQAKLLRALQEKEVHPVGRDPVPVDVRVVAATNQDLKQRIDGGSFRADLYYRLAGYVLEIPPLRERPEDIPDLVEHFLRDCAQELDRPIRGLTVRALRLLTEYPWPGNVRELANEVRRAVYLCSDRGTIESSTLSASIVEPSAAPVEEKATERPAAGAEVPFSVGAEDETQKVPAPDLTDTSKFNLGKLEKRTIQAALNKSGQNQVQAAKLLGISRQSLRRRIERLNLTNS